MVVPGECSERLQKVLARAGIASRRACEELIRQGRVVVNGQVVRKMGLKVGAGDLITVDGVPVRVHGHKVYFLLNKPKGYVTTVSDELGRPTVMDLIPSGQRLFPVGRLDADSEGLLIVTNDGDLTYRLTHPRFGFEKEYRVLVDGRPSEEELEKLRRGVVLDGKRTAPAKVRRLGNERDGTWLAIVIHEGRKRQIRRMLATIGYNVLRLVRVRVGPLALDDLAPGAWRPLSRDEIAALFRAL